VPESGIRLEEVMDNREFASLASLSIHATEVMRARPNQFFVHPAVTSPSLAGANHYSNR